MDTTRLLSPEEKTHSLIAMVLVAVAVGLCLGAVLAWATRDAAPYEFVSYTGGYEPQGCNAPYTESLLVEYEFC